MPRLRVIDDEAIERPFNKEQFKRLLTFLKPYKGRIAFALCLMVISAMCSLALPMLMSKAIDQIDAGNAHNFPFFLIAMVIGGLDLRALSCAHHGYRGAQRHCGYASDAV